MALVVNTNVASLVAQNQLVGSRAEMEQAMERLSSGKRINNAGDDAAGLAISNRMEAQARGLSQAVRNANDGVSLVDTAEGTMQEVTNMLQRMRELAVQSANGIYNDSDRVSLNEEVSQLKAEMDRIASTTTFNNNVLVDGSFGSLQLQLGQNDGQNLSVQMADIRAVALGTGAGNAVSAFGDKGTAGSLDQNLDAGDLVINGVAVGSTLAADDSLSFGDKASSAIAKAAAINRISEQTGVTASVGTTVFEGSVMSTASATGSVTINGINTADIAVTSDAGASRRLVVDAINDISSQTGVRAVDSGSDNNGVKLIADDGRNITLSFTTLSAGNTGLGSAGVQTGSFSLQSTNGEAIVVSSNSDVSTDIEKSGLRAGTYSKSESYLASDVRAVAGAGTAPATANAGVLNLGDMVINGVTIAAALAEDDTASAITATSSTKAASAIAIAAAINKSSEETGVRAVAEANVVHGTGFTAGGVSGAFSINGVAITTSSLSADSTRQDVADAVNAFAGQTGVVATDNGQGLTYTAEDGRNISFAMSAKSGDLANLGLTGASGAVASGAAASAITTYSRVTLVSDSAFTVEAGANGATNLGALGFTEGTFGGTSDGQKISDISISTQADALKALSAIDNALETVLAERGKLGAIRNRLDFTAANLGNVVTNTEASRSRIEDADFAAESAKLAKNQILLQAGTAMLAQANASQQTVLSLLG